jgi:hypothetical protein
MTTRPHAPTILAEQDSPLGAAIVAAHEAIQEFSEQLASVRTDAARYRFLARQQQEIARNIELPRTEREQAAERARWYRETAWALGKVATAQDEVLERVRALLRTLAGGEASDA